MALPIRYLCGIALNIPGFYQPVWRVRARNIHVTIMPFSRWTELFENTAMVAALIDRVAFRSHVLDMNGDSYQLMATIHKKSPFALTLRFRTFTGPSGET